MKKLINKAKAAIPKAVKAVRKIAQPGIQKTKKVIQQVKQALPPKKSLNPAVEKVISAIPSGMRETGAKYAKKMKAAVSSANYVTWKAQNKVSRLFRKSKSSSQKKVEAPERKEDYVEGEQSAYWRDVFKETKIVDKMCYSFVETKDTVIRGSVGMLSRNFEGPVDLVFNYERNKAFLEGLEMVVEQNPVLYTPFRWLGETSDSVAKDISSSATAIGNKIYSWNIPILSGLGGAAFGSDIDTGEGVGAAIGGVIHGVVGDGALGTVKGVVDMASDPIQTAKGLNWMVGKPEESLPAIYSGVKKYVNDNVVDGNAESRGRAAGAIAFEIGSFFLGGAAVKGTKAVDTVGDAGRASKKVGQLQDVFRFTKGANTVGGTPAGGKTSFFKNMAEAYRSSGNAIKDIWDDLARGGNGSGLQPAFAGGGLGDDAGVWYDRFINGFNKGQDDLNKVKFSNTVNDGGRGPGVKGGSGALGESIGKSLKTKGLTTRADLDDFINLYKQSDEYLSLSNSQRKVIDRKLLGLQKGNVAIADVDIPGLKSDFKAHSQIHSESTVGSNAGDFSYTPSTDKRFFETYVEDAFPRYNDTEAKILEDIASQISDPNIKGRINLYSELDCCQSCSNLILEFRNKFPNIELNIVTNSTIK